MMEKEKKKKGKKLVVGLIVLGLILIAGGGVLTYFSSPSYVSKTVIKEFGQKATELMNSRIETGLEDNYKTTSNIKMNLKSDYFSALATMDPSYAMISNLLNNLSNTENNITMVQDKENKKLFFNLDSKLSGQSLINTKYLVENATAYYSIDGVTNTYVNNGNNNYFESLNSSTTTNENLKYLIEKIAESMANNLEESYLSESYTDEYKVITITLTEQNIVTYGNKIINDLKNDEKANQIMTGYNANFSEVKLTEKDVTGTGTIKVNIYLDKILSQVSQYELELGNGNKCIYYKENGKEIVELISEEETTTLEIEKHGEKTEINIKDGSNASLGTVTISQTSTNYDIVANITSEEATLDFGYNYQITNLKKGTSYDSAATITIKMTAQNTTIIDGTITVTGQTTNDTTISEDTSTSVLASTLSGTQTELLQQKIALIILSLMS
ncbi:MAG TPA: hypothetical protein IAD45_03160 [Candidatus Faecimonas intestinavium]|nr:hypothetical protein [Bacilli bacterium]HIT23396.1 hypothetical protein [Candidatus Faecimonas intestinavium]